MNSPVPDPSDVGMAEREPTGAAADGRRLGDADFGQDYYAHGCGVPYGKDEHWLRFYSPIADGIVSRIRPRRVLDAGCAMGFLVEMLRQRGVEAYGIDISSYAIAHVPDPVKPFCRQASITDVLTERYDLIICQEVIPHVTPSGAEFAIANFCGHTDDVLFSSVPVVDPTVPRHINFQPPEHFAELFARHGFYRDFAFDASFLTPWAVRYRRLDGDVSGLVREYESRLRAQQLRLDQAHQALSEAKARIVGMERSRCWKARTIWARLSGR